MELFYFSQEFAVKVESAKTKHPQLQHEYLLYRLMLNNGGLGVPDVK